MKSLFKPMSTTTRYLKDNASRLVAGWVGKPRVFTIKEQINHMVTGALCVGVYILVCWVHSTTNDVDVMHPKESISIACYDNKQ